MGEVTGFVQIIEVEAASVDELLAVHERWLAATEGQRTVVAERICADRDRPGTYVMIVEFGSYDDAMRNNDLPATGEIAAGIAALAGAPPVFRNLDVVRKY